jgi:glutaminyl-tRNA synthetase
MEPTTDFIRNIIKEDLKAGKNGGKVVTRFPPEPNGYLHIGHAKSICLNFGIAKAYNGPCHLRFDDTNPERESDEYKDSIKTDVKWLGFDWGEHLYHASDYFEKLYEYAVQLIQLGKAYVCSQTAEEIRQNRGTLSEPGRNCPYRDRTVEENLDLFQRMRAGEFPDGAHVLRAKIDMASGNINMRDPVLYRIRHVEHHQTGAKWCIYPMYDYTHCLSDAIEGITHSLCTLEFEDHRPLYDWCLDTLETPCHPQQIEFARLEFNYTVTSKRKLKQLVEENWVSGWGDPRMPTIQGIRNRGVPASAIRAFCEMIGVSKKKTIIDMTIFEDCVREELNVSAPRALCVLHPLKVVLTNFPEGTTEVLKAPNHPQNPEFGKREMLLEREIYIEQEDFMENPPKDYFRLRPGGEVRLRYGHIIRCNDVIRDSETGNVVELHCTYDPATLGVNPSDRKVKGVIQWVSQHHSFKTPLHMYDRLFTAAEPTAKEKEGVPYTQFFNPESLVIQEAYVESSLKQSPVETRIQFERHGYFYCTPNRTPEGYPIFNKIVSLRDRWGEAAKR